MPGLDFDITPQIANARQAADKARGMSDFLFWCNHFCGYTDINASEHGDFIAKVEKLLTLFKGRRERALHGRPDKDDSLKVTFHDEAARGTFKTSIWIAFCTRLIAEDRQVAIRFNVNKVENAEKKVAEIGRLLRKGRIPKHFGQFYNAGHWSRKSIKLIDNHSPDPTVQAGGPDERQASTHCDIIINSDCQDKENSLTHELREKTEDWRGDEQNLFRQKTCYRLEVWDSTRWHSRDIAGQLLEVGERSPKPKLFWTHKQPVADWDEWQSDPRNCKLGFPSLFPRHKIESLFDYKASGMREYDVRTQYFLDTRGNVNTRFRNEWLQSGPGYDPAATINTDSRTNVCLLPKKMNLFVTIDPADADEIRKAREKGDMVSLRGKCDTGMVLWGMDEAKNRIVLAAISDQFTIPEIGMQIVRWFRAYHCPDRTKRESEWPLFGAGDRAKRTWIMQRVGVEKVLFSAGAIIPPLKAFLAAQRIVGPDWARKWLGDRSAIQISTQKSKAARQDGTEVAWASGSTRVGQHQTDLDGGIEHPAQVLIDAKKNYPTISRWDVLDAESLGYGPSFMYAPREETTEHDAFVADLNDTLKQMMAIERGNASDVTAMYREQMADRKAQGKSVLYGPGQYVGN